jgi:Domain of unknown function (DUF4349)
MTMLDDDRLTSLFARAGASFDVPVSGPDDILARATGRLAESGDGDGGAVDGGGVDGGGTDDEDATTALPVPLRQGRVRRVAGIAGRHRMLSVAASIVVVLVLAGALGALVRSPSSSNLSSSVARPAVAAPRGVPTTTVPPGFSSNQRATAQSPSAALGAGAASGTTSGPAVTTPTTAPPLPSGAVGQPAKIEQTGSLGLKVRRGDLGRTVTQLSNLAIAYGGFVANSQTQSGASSGGAPSGNVTLQVPVNDFATVLKRAQALGKTSDLTTKATDVTGQYVDLQARIAALEATRQQYLTILAKATTVGDILSVQEELDTVQTQIEQLQGQLQLLTSQTSYSTLTVTVSEGTPAPQPAALPESGLVRAWHASIGGFVAGVEGLIRVAGPLLFALLLLGVVLVGGRTLWRRVQRHRL